jgi:hypothetical protein
VYPARGVALELRLGGAPQRVELPGEYRNLPGLEEPLPAVVPYAPWPPQQPVRVPTRPWPPQEFAAPAAPPVPVQRPLLSLESVAGQRVRAVGLPGRVSLGRSPLDQRVLNMRLPVTLEDGQVVDVPVELLGTRSAQGVWELVPRSGELPEVLRQPVAEAVRANLGVVYPARGVALELRLGGAPQRVELPGEYRKLPGLDEFLVAAPRR